MYIYLSFFIVILSFFLSLFSCVHVRDVHGTKKNFLVPVKDLCAVSLTQLLNYCLTAHFVEKCLLFQPMYFKIYHRSSLTNNLADKTTGTSLPGPTGTN